jgi:hypothetical protein
MIKLPHIKVPQDKKIAYAALPLAARLNLDANTNAIYYKNLHKR